MLTDQLFYIFFFWPNTAESQSAFVPEYLCDKRKNGPERIFPEATVCEKYNGRGKGDTYIFRKRIERLES
jgi:hypothetical protein